MGRPRRRHRHDDWESTDHDSGTHASQRSAQAARSILAEDSSTERGTASDDDVAIAAITLAELTVGVELAAARQRSRRQSYVDEIAASIPILPYDEPVASRHATLLVAVRKAGRPRGAHDLIIAATAAAAGRTVVSADRRAFDELPGITAIDHRSG